jgi:EAL domain-containing protein (putative c-di-GMP-specific phosphodiesterase class I)
VSLAKDFKLDTIAEGVEMETQLNWLKQIQCDYFQGYLFSPPVPAFEIEQMLQTKNERQDIWPLPDAAA